MPGSPFIAYPCDVTLKIIGKSSPTFEITALQIVRKHFPNLTEGALKTSYSHEKKFLALRITVHVEDRKQLESLAADLKNNPEILVSF